VGKSRAYVDLVVPDVNGGTAIWRAELSSPNNLIFAGITKNMIQAGNDVAVDGFVARSGTLRVGSSSIVVKTAGVTVTIPPAAWPPFLRIVQFEISDFGFEMQDSSDFKIP
jgi:hypothetical protein